MKKIKLFIAAMALLVSSLAFAQNNITVKGTVTDALSGEAVPFASIQLKGTTSGASSDGDGNYEITVPSNGTLVFSSIGYRNFEILVSNRSVINVVLETDTEFINETIVVAYGTATKSSFTGSAAVVDSKTIATHVSTSVTGTLAGTTPGVQVISSSGDPTNQGGVGGIVIRGIGSMSASNSPLVILDGMPYDGALSDINPNDVESMSVLKDAAASAIYGARGANGVILVTTKKAAAGEAIVKFDAKWGSNSRLIPQYDVITDPAQYYETHYRQMYNSKIYAGSSEAEAYRYADENIFNEQNGGLGYRVFDYPAGEKFIGTNFKVNPNATLGYSDGTYYYTPDDWYNEVFHNSFRQEYNLSASGSSDRFNYYSSFGFLEDGGVVENSDYKRFTGRVNAEYQAKDWFKVTTSMSFSHSDSQQAQYSSQYGSSGNLFYVTNLMAPIYPLYVRDAEGNIMYENGEPVYDANQTGFKRAGIVGNAVRDNAFNRTKSYADVVVAKGGFVFTPFAGLTLTANVGVTSDNTRGTDLASVFAGNTGTDGAVLVSQSRLFTVNTQYLAEYKTDFGGSKSNFDILAGYEQYRYKRQTLSGQNDHLFDPYIAELNNADGSKSKQLGSSTTNYLTSGFLSRAQYDYDGKYFVSASFRRDSSSRFAKGHRKGNFGSVGGAWLISEESFLSGAHWIDMLKFKASYGIQGNDDLQSYYPYADQYTHSYDADNNSYSSQLSYKGNEDLTWESSHSFNAGFDFEFFHGRLNGTIEGFNRKTVDLLYSKDVPLSSGNPTGVMPVNVGSISNRGLELSLDGIAIARRNFTWSWNVNLSHYKNEILSLDESVAEDGILGSYRILRVGGSMYQAYVRKYAGVDPKTGKGLYYYDEEDEDGNVVTKTTDVFSNASQYDIGSILPKLYGGFGTSINFYNFDFSAQFSFQLGGRFYDGNYQGLMHTSGGTGNAWHKDVLKSWGEPGAPEDTNIPRLDGDKSVGQTAVDCFFISSNYLSVNNVTLGYTFPKSVVSKLSLSGLRVYVSGENLAVLSARKGVDPRYSMGLGSMTQASGLSSGNYSAMRNVTAGVSITF